MALAIDIANPGQSLPVANWNYGAYTATWPGTTSGDGCPNGGLSGPVTARLADAIADLRTKTTVAGFDRIAITAYFLSPGDGEVDSDYSIGSEAPQAPFPLIARCGPYQDGPSSCVASSSLDCEVTDYNWYGIFNTYDLMGGFPQVKPMTPPSQSGESASSVAGLVPLNSPDEFGGFLAKPGGTTLADLLWSVADVESAEFTYAMDGSSHTGSVQIYLSAYAAFDTSPVGPPPPPPQPPTPPVPPSGAIKLGRITGGSVRLGAPQGTRILR